MFVCANFVSGLHRFQCWQNVKWLIRWWPRKSQGTSRDSLTKLFDFLSFRILFMNYSSDPKPKSERNNSEENPIKILLRNRDFSSNGEGKILVNSVIKHIVTISSPCISKMFIKYSPYNILATRQKDRRKARKAKGKKVCRRRAKRFHRGEIYLCFIRKHSQTSSQCVRHGTAMGKEEKGLIIRLMYEGNSGKFLVDFLFDIVRFSSIFHVKWG